MKLKFVALLVLALVASLPVVAGTVYPLPQMYVSIPSPMVPSPYHIDKVQVFGLNTFGFPADVQVTDNGFAAFFGWSIVNTGLGWSQLSGQQETSFATFDLGLDIPSFPGYVDSYLIRNGSILYAQRMTVNAIIPAQGDFLGWVDMNIDQIPTDTYQLDSGTGRMTVIDPPATATPEPSPFALLAGGGVILLFGKYRYKYTA